MLLVLDAGPTHTPDASTSSRSQMTGDPSVAGGWSIGERFLLRRNVTDIGRLYQLTSPFPVPGLKSVGHEAEPPRIDHHPPIGLPARDVEPVGVVRGVGSVAGCCAQIEVDGQSRQVR